MEEKRGGRKLNLVEGIKEREMEGEEERME